MAFRREYDGYLTPSNLQKPTFIPFLEKRDDETSSMNLNWERSQRESQRDSTGNPFKAVKNAK